MLRKSLIIATALFFVTTTYGAQATVFGPQKLSPGLLSPTQKTYQFQASGDNIASTLVVIAGDGRDLSQQKCTGKLAEVLKCTLLNVAKALEVALTRPSSVEVNLNNKVVVDKKSYSPEKGTLQIVGIVNKSNSIKIKVGGLFTSSAKFEVKAENQKPNISPIAQYSANPVTGYAPLLVSFNALTSYDPDGSIVSYEWDFADGNSASGAIVSHLFQTSGNYAVKLTVTDDRGGKNSIVYSLNVLNNVRPIAMFVATANTDIGVLNLHLDANESVDSDGQILAYEWDLGDGSTKTGKVIDHVYTQQGTFNVKLLVTDNLGAQASVVKAVEVFDRRKPNLTLSSPQNGKTFYTQSLPIQINVVGSSDEPLKQVLINSNIASIYEQTSFNYNVNISQSGPQDIQVKVFDLHNNETENTVSVNVVVDNILPQLQLSSSKNLTNQNEVLIQASVVEDNLLSTEIFINGASAFSISEKNFSINVPLNNEGINKIEVQSTDLAGNKSGKVSVDVIKDTLPPVLSNLVPQNNSNIDRIVFAVSGKSSEKLSTVNVNGLSLNIAQDGVSFSGSYVAAGQGHQPLLWTAVDMAGNEITATSEININSRLLIPELVSIVPGADGQHLSIVGVAGATRPSVKVEASTGMFSFNRGETVSSNDGSFEIVLDPFLSATVKVTDLSSSETASVDLTRSNETRLSGIVRDTDGNPLPGAKVSIIGSGLSTFTDSSGIFNITNSLTGDQTLEVDGRTIPQSVTGANRKFSKTKLVINIGLSQENILDRPIFLTPLLIDGTQTVIAQNASATIESPAAPGVSIDVPANSVVFPDGTNVGVINIATIASDKTTIEVPVEAAPTKVLSLEPSGLKFTQRVPITLPNDNDLPPGVEMAILSMNSSSGQWEVDGFAKVSENGQSIESKPNSGISHFSLVYAVPVGPVVSTVSNPNLLGVNVSDGSLARGLLLPSFKTNGKEVAPGLVYKSAWANPNAVVSNLFDIPKQQIEYTMEQKDTTSAPIVATVRKCLYFNVIGCRNVVEEYLLEREYADTTSVQSWYEPDSIKSQFYISGIATDDVEFKNTNTVPGSSTREMLPGDVYTFGINSDVATYTGIPNRSTISYSVPLKNPETNEYLTTGIYPTLARYQIRLRNMTMTTSTRVLTTKVKRSVVDVKTVQRNSQQSRILDQVFPSDLVGSVLVQNKVNSSYGRGWHLVGPQKIVNPANNKILIEESKGDLSTYSINNTIETIFNAQNSSIDLASGVDLSRWPDAYMQQVDGQNVASVVKVNLENSGQNAALVSSLPQYTGTIGNEGSSICPRNWNATTQTTLHPYKMVAKLGGIATTANGQLFGTDSRQHLLFTINGANSRRIGGAEGPIESVFGIPQPGFSMATADLNSWCKSNLGAECGTPQVQDVYSCTLKQPPACIPGTFCKPWDEPNFIASSGFAGKATFRGDDIVGALSDGSQVAVNNPQGIAVSQNGDVVIADSGNNRVRILNLTTNTIRTYAGNGSNVDSGDGGLATDAGLYHPKGLTFDSIGNLYISTENGYIRKVDVNGKISNLAGLPIGSGGILSDEAPASKMAFNNPHGLIFDNENQYLYVADAGSHRVIRIDIDSGIASTVAGNGNCSEVAIGDSGTALSASLCSPSHLGLDRNGNLLVVDSGHKRIRRINFSNSSTGTLAFSPTANDSTSLVRQSDGTWVRSYRNGSKVYFDPEGYQQSSVDRAGRVTSYTYDSGKRLISIQEPTGQKTEYNYSGNLLNNVVDPAGRTTSFRYIGQTLAEVDFPDGSSKRFEYFPNGEIAKEIDQRGFAQSFKFNSWGRIEKVTDVLGNVTTISDGASYSMSNNFTNGQTGNLTNAGFGPNEVRDIVADPRSSVTEFVKDYNGFVTKEKDAKGNLTTYMRDIDGQLVKITHSDSSTVSMTYDPISKDLLKVEHKPSGAIETAEYDIYGNVVKRVDGAGNVVRYNFDPDTGLLVSESLNGVLKYSQTYNSQKLVESRSVRQSASKVLTTRYEYDASGNTTRVIAPDGKYTDYIYDSAGNIVKKVDNVNSASKLVTSYSYNNFNKLTSVINPDGKVISYTYLPTGELSSVTDANGKVSSFEYDAAGKVLKKTDPKGLSYQYTYDVNGNMLTELDPKGQTKNYSYDENNRTSQILYPDDIIKLEYNSRGDLVQLSNLVSRITYQRDERGRVLQSQTVGLGQMANYPASVINYDYTLSGSRHSLVTSGFSIGYFYDGLGRMNALANSSGDNFHFIFDEANRISTLQRPGSTSNYTYTDGSLISSIAHKNGNNILSQTAYTYTDHNYMASKTGNFGINNFAYDSKNQLTSVSGITPEVFSYDLNGNRISDQNGTSIVDESNQQLKEDWQYTYAYDNNGNLIQKLPKDLNKPAYLYSYSSKNQLVEVRILDKPLGRVISQSTYAYDAYGRRMQKIVLDQKDIANPRIKTRKFVYDITNILMEYDGDNKVLAKYTYSPLVPDDILAAEITSDGAMAGLSVQPGRYYYLKDSQGSITDITDGSGNIVQRYDYSSFGKIERLTNASGVDIKNAPYVNTSFTYTGREWDSESDLYYYRARYYDANTGRFIQKDPEPGSLNNTLSVTNSYIYTNNSPMAFTDPTGRIAWFIAIPLIAALTGLIYGAIFASVTGQDVWAGALSGAKSGFLVGLGTVAGIYVAGVLAGGAAIGSGAAIMGGALGGGTAGAIIGAIENPGNPGLGALVGFVMGALGGATAGSGNLPFFDDVVSGTFMNAPSFEIPNPTHGLPPVATPPPPTPPVVVPIVTPPVVTPAPIPNPAINGPPGRLP